MPNEQVVKQDDNDLDGLLAQMGFTDPDEVVEAAEPAVAESVGEFSIEDAALQKLEDKSALQDHYAAEDTADVTDEVVPTPAPAPKKGKGKTDEEKAAAKAARDAARAAKKAAQPAAAPRKFYTSPAERVTDKLGADLGNFTVLTLSDAALTGDALAAKQKETMDLLENNAKGTKVQKRIVYFVEFAAGRSSILNPVNKRACELLKKDGHIKSGDKGNLHLNLLAKPYTPSAARAMGNNTIAAMRELKMIVKGADGNYVANPESLMLVAINNKLGL